MSPPPLPDMAALAGKVVVITGSSRGIGLVLAKELAAAGARVVLHGRSAASLDAARQALPAATAIAADLTRPGEAERLVTEAVAACGQVDLLVLNAAEAGPMPTPLWQVDAAGLREIFEIDVTAALLSAGAFIRHALGRGGGGRVVTMLSQAARRPFRGIAPYCVAKAALAAATRSLALDLDGSGIAVIGIEPAPHQTDMTRPRIGAKDFARLDPPETILPLLLWALAGPAERLHGRILSETRFARDAAAEALLAGPAALIRPFKPFMPRLAGTGEGRHLDFLENPSGAPATAVRAARKAAAGLATYPDPALSGLRAALAGRLGLPAEALSFGPGSGEVVERLLRTFVRPGGSVVTTDPGWPMLDRLCAGLGIEVRAIACRLERAAPRIAVPVERLLGTVDSTTGLVYLTNPHFPLGCWLDEAELRRLLAGLRGAVPLVVDEAYADFAGSERTGLAPRLAAEGQGLLAVRTFSKFHGLAGLRLGYAFGPPHLIDAARRLEVGFAIPALAEQAALAALGDEAHARHTRARLAKAAATLKRGLARLGWRWLESDVNFLMAECPFRPERVFDALHEAGLHTPEVAWRGFVMLPVATADDSRRIIHVLSRLA